MSIPYRIQQRLKRLTVILLVVAVVAAVVLLCWFLWLDRYVVYTRDGAVFDFERSSEELTGEPAVPPGEENLISIYYNEGEDAVETGTDLSQMIGYYIDYNALLRGIDGVKQQLDNLPAGTAVMLEVKNSFGTAYYNSSTIPYRSDTLDPAMVDELIRYMNSKNLYTIAAFPSLRDFSYALDHQQIGLDHTGGYLWVDRDNVYWLDPTEEATVSYLTDIANELRVLGFREVVFLDFQIPDDSNVALGGDHRAILENLAQNLLISCGTNAFAVSFETVGEFTLPEGRSRVYKTEVDAIEAKNIAENSGVSDVQTRLVFITDLYDTRFDEYSVLRPLSFAE